MDKSSLFSGLTGGGPSEGLAEAGAVGHLGANAGHTHGDHRHDTGPQGAHFDRQGEGLSAGSHDQGHLSQENRPVNSLYYKKLSQSIFLNKVKSLSYWNRA